MISAILTVKVDGVSTDDPLGIKEAAVMSLEHLGRVAVTRVEIEEPQQLSMTGGAEPPPRAVSAPALTSAPSPVPAPPRPVDKPKPQARRQLRPQAAMECCFNCACYCSGQGRDAAGEFYWGTCGPLGAPVYDIKDRCNGWAPLQRRREC